MFYYDGNINDLEKSGIYVLVNIKNNKKYLGSAVLFKRRILEHFKKLEAGKHNNPHLQSAYNIDGKNNFKMIILELCDKEKTLEIEQKYLDEAIKNWKNYYNISKIANGYDGMKGYKHSSQTKQKLSKMRQGKNNTFYGKRHSSETKDKISKTKLSSSKKGIKSSRYISEIIAENIQTGEKIISQSEIEMSKLLNVSQAAIHHRLNKNIDRYTESPIKNIWKIYRIKI